MQGDSKLATIVHYHRNEKDSLSLSSNTGECPFVQCGSPKPQQSRITSRVYCTISSDRWPHSAVNCQLLRNWAIRRERYRIRKGQQICQVSCDWHLFCVYKFASSRAVCKCLLGVEPFTCPVGRASYHSLRGKLLLGRFFCISFEGFFVCGKFLCN